MTDTQPTASGSPAARCPAPGRLDAIAAGEALDGAAAAHLATCARCADQVAALRRDRDEFLRRRPAALFLRQLEARRRPARRSWLWRLVLFAAGGGAAVAALLTVGNPMAIRSKGSPLTVVYRRGDADPRPVAPELRLRAGDALRFSYAPPGDGYLAILDLDATGRVTTFYPYGASGAAPLAAAGTGWLPGSVVLDGALGPEWLISVFDARPFELAPLSAQLSGLAPGATPALRCGSCRVELLRIHKAP